MILVRFLIRPALVVLVKHVRLTQRQTVLMEMAHTKVMIQLATMILVRLFEVRVVH